MKKKILLVDDEVGFTALLQINLEQTGLYEVRVETEGGKVLEAVRYFQPDLILLDVIMPDISGREVATQLAAEENTKEIPIVYLTATVSREEVVDHGGVIGGHRSLAKPSSMAEILACVEEVLGDASTSPS